MNEHVVLVHGLFFRSPVMAWLAKRLRSAGFVTHLFNYKTRSESLPVLAQQLNQFVSSRSIQTMNVLAHSLGGLVTMEMLSHKQALPPGRVVLLGSPVGGNRLARHLASGRAGRFLFGKSGATLAGGWEYQATGRDIGIIAGTRPYGAGRLVRIFDEPNDGTVAVAETRMPGAAGHIQLPVTHTSMLFSAKVADQSICFFKSGAFQK